MRGVVLILMFLKSRNSTTINHYYEVFVSCVWRTALMLVLLVDSLPISGIIVGRNRLEKHFPAQREGAITNIYKLDFKLRC